MQLLALAFGGSKPRKGQSAGKKKTSQPSSTTGGAINDAVWQKRDEQFVDDTYRRQLEEALAASKIDYEREKMVLSVVVWNSSELFGAVSSTCPF